MINFSIRLYHNDKQGFECFIVVILSHFTRQPSYEIGATARLVFNTSSVCDEHDTQYSFMVTTAIVMNPNRDEDVRDHDANVAFLLF